MKNILLEKAFNYKRKKKLKNLPGYKYNEKIGAWISVNNKKIFLIKSNDYNLPNLGTKKEDVETGEDQKGA
jgi:hypothetical protein